MDCSELDIINGILDENNDYLSWLRDNTVTTTGEALSTKYLNKIGDIDKLRLKNDKEYQKEVVRHLGSLFKLPTPLSELPTIIYYKDNDGEMCALFKSQPLNKAELIFLENENLKPICANALISLLTEENIDNNDLNHIYHQINNFLNVELEDLRFLNCMDKDNKWEKINLTEINELTLSNQLFKTFHLLN